MFMRIKMTAVAVASAVLILSHATWAKDAPAGDVVVAVVNGSTILKGEVTGAIKTVPQLQGANVDEVFPAVVDQIINEKLLDTETEKAKVAEGADYKKRLDDLKKQFDAVKAQLVRQVYLEKFLKDSVTDAQIKVEYEKFKKENQGKEEVHARHILVSTEAEAVKVIKDLDGGAKFEDLAKQRSSGPTAQNGGDLNYFVKEEMLPEFSEAAFKLQKNEYSKAPVKTQFGWHVIRVEDRRSRAVPEMKDVQAVIRNKLGQQALDGLVQKLRAKADIKKFDINGKPLEEAKKG